MGETMEVRGYCDSKFDEVRDVLTESLKTRADIGASVAATIEGEMVIDLWGGHLDEEASNPWQQDTIVNVYSSTKTMSFLCALLLADRGDLDFDANVAEYWPEFAQNGKEHGKVWHIMDHAAGLSGLDEAVTTNDLYDWEKITGMLARQTPWWEPGTATAYHAITQGYLIGEVVRRISGKTLGQFFADEIASPLEADFFIGVPESEFPRIGHLLPPDDATALAGQGDEDSIASRTFRYPAVNALDSRTREWRLAEIPAANGHGNARSIAKIHAILACKGEAQGIRLLKPETAESVMVERISGTDMALQMPVRFGLGFGINAREKILAPNENVCYWGGWGGSLALIDQDAKMSFSYVMNRMEVGLTGDLRSYNLSQAIYRAL
jgi:CubicO group peptidase (beta-lactamase class C family)